VWSLRMRHAIPLLPLYAFMAWKGKSSLFPKLFNVGTHIFSNEAVRCFNCEIHCTGTVKLHLWNTLHYDSSNDNQTKCMKLRITNQTNYNRFHKMSKESFLQQNHCGNLKFTRLQYTSLKTNKLSLLFYNAVFVISLLFYFRITPTSSTTFNF